MSPDTTFHASLGTARVYRASRGAIDAGILGQHTAVEFSRLNFGRCSAARPELRPVAGELAGPAGSIVTAMRFT